MNNIYEATEDEGAASSPAGALGEIGESAMAFAAVEGQGLFWEAQRGLVAWFVGVAVFGLLLHAIVASEAVKELMEDAAAGCAPGVGPPEPAAHR